ncbi:MAG: peroxiredoxin [Agitococcus sp.]
MCISQPWFNSSQISLAANWVGKPAPAFNLSDQTGKVRQLADFKGKWLVMYFYPKNHTSGCTEEAKRFRDQYPQFQKQNINVVGVSLDSVESHKSFAKDYNLPFTLLVDTNKDLAKKWAYYKVMVLLVLLAVKLF